MCVNFNILAIKISLINSESCQQTSTQEVSLLIGKYLMLKSLLISANTTGNKSGYIPFITKLMVCT